VSGLPVANLERCTDRDVSFRDGLIACKNYLAYDLVQMADGARAAALSHDERELERLRFLLAAALTELEKAQDAYDQAFPLDDTQLSMDEAF
jgi:hypothetical protein